MYHQPYKSLLAILGTVKELGGRPDKTAVHNAAKLYRSIQSTGQRLSQLNRLELIHQQSNGKEFVYFLSAKGKKMLRLSGEEQMNALKRRQLHADAPRECVTCKDTGDLMWCRDGFYCPIHLNEDIETPEPRTRTASNLHGAW